jgi:hypothetical protein
MAWRVEIFLRTVGSLIEICFGPAKILYILTLSSYGFDPVFESIADSGSSAGWLMRAPLSLCSACLFLQCTNFCPRIANRSLYRPIPITNKINPTI